jgi:hypothetical protein
MLLKACMPEATSADLCALSMGQRDALLLEFYAVHFNATLASQARCPECGADVEIEMSAEDLLTSETDTGQARCCQVEVDSYGVEIRIPTIGDVLAGMVAGDDPREFLMDRCVSIVHSARPVAGGTLPDAVLAAVEDRLSQLDPLADVQLTITCPECDHRWCEVFDIVEHLWLQLEQQALCMLRDIHVLATAYGWSENEVLQLSPQRRRVYLEMARVCVASGRPVLARASATHCGGRRAGRRPTAA